MNVYLDSSVVLRVILDEPDRLATWSSITRPVSSELVRLECLRTIDRARIRLGLDDTLVARHRADVLEIVASMTLVPVGPAVLARAAGPFPTLLGSLDAIHLASALLVREQWGELTLATHDVELGWAAVAVGMPVQGVSSAPG